MMDAGLRDASDASLVVAIARFRDTALAEVYRRHGDAAFGLAVRVLCDRTLAEELVQEVFLKLWQDPERFDPARGSLRAFLMAETMCWQYTQGCRRGAMRKSAAIRGTPVLLRTSRQMQPVTHSRGRGRT